MIINDSVLKNSEKISFALRALYLGSGCTPYRMSKFEEYDLYAKNKDFLISDNVITFTDTDGTLMALKPDVTLSIIKGSIDEPEKTRKLFYDENVYRVSKDTGSFKEIMQTGVECFGKVGEDELCGILLLSAESLRLISEKTVLAVSDLDILSELIADLKLPASAEKQLYDAISEKNGDAVSVICRGCADEKAAVILQKLIRLHGPAKDVLAETAALFSGRQSEAYESFRSVIGQLLRSEYAPMISVDFSVTGDISYYNGIVFKGFLEGIPSAVLSGGQYDKLMDRLGRRSKAVGFAIYLDVLERIDVSAPETADAGERFLNVALPKGRLGEQIYDMFARAGYECPSILETNRKLIFENSEKKIRYFWVKPSDVPIYVERGAADIGVAGKDILLEYEPDIYELLDLKKGKCRMMVAGPQNYTDDSAKTLRVATKFANITEKYYRAKGRDIDIIRLNGSIEIAPLLGLSDVIVDIVETGTTLRENKLEIKEEILPISARLIANKASFKFNGNKIEEIVQSLSALIATDGDPEEKK